MNEITQFEVPCHHRSEGMFCWQGNLYVIPFHDEVWPAEERADLAILEGSPVKCPACKGLGYILTLVGQQLVGMLWRHLEPKIVELIQEFD